MIESQCQGWFCVHWAQWASISTEKDVQELRHLISEFYSVPPMAVVWTHGHNARLLDPEFQDFVNEIIRDKQ